MVNLKEKIADTLEVNIDRLDLIFKLKGSGDEGVSLKDDAMTMSALLETAGEVESTRVNLMLKLRGGGKAKLDADGQRLTKETRLRELKDELFGMTAVATQAAALDPLVGKVKADIDKCMGIVDTPGFMSALLAELPKDALLPVVASLSCGNLDQKVAVLRKAMFAETVEAVKGKKAAFAKLDKAMEVVTEILLTASYFEDGSMKWSSYSKDVFDAK